MTRREAPYQRARASASLVTRSLALAAGEVPMPRKKKTDAAPTPLFDAKVMTAPCVAAIRDKVAAWRDAGYPSTTDTTRRLLHHWFHTDHRLADGRKFKYHYFQQHAVETLVYLY